MNPWAPYLHLAVALPLCAAGWGFVAWVVRSVRVVVRLRWDGIRLRVMR